MFQAKAAVLQTTRSHAGTLLTSSSLRAMSSSPLGGLVGNRVVGVRRETKNRWERRVPLTPSHVRKLIRDGIRVLVQPSPMRIFPDSEYLAAGAELKEDISEACVILGVKEVPIELMIPSRTYLNFSHTIKAQEANLPALDAYIQKNIRLIDYERMVDKTGKRVIGFGRFAGNAGMIDLLRGLGDRLLGIGYSTPFLGLGYADYYYSLAAAKTAVNLVGHNIRLNGVPRDLSPFIFGFTGNGNVTKGALEIFHELPVEMVNVSDLPSIVRSRDSKTLYGVMIEREHCVEHQDPDKDFDLREYTAFPERFRPTFHKKVAPYLTALVNGMYWDARFPRLLTCEQMKKLYLLNKNRMLAIADISADPYGSIEFTRELTKIDRPFLVYNPVTDESVYGWEAEGVLLGSVDNLPAEFPREASSAFGDRLLPYVYELVESNGDVPFEKQNDMSPTLLDAVITSGGALTPNYRYIDSLRKEREAKKLKILLFGSGFVAEPLVKYLTSHADLDVSMTICSADTVSATSLASKYKKTHLRVADVTKDGDLDAIVPGHNIVLSFVPAPLHPRIARACIRHGVNMVTSSYVSPEMEALHEDAVAKGVTILNEVGLDPGIDHLRAMQMMDDIKASGGKIDSYVSWCGGLPAPECSNNPLGYKFSWSVKGVLTAGLQSARYLQRGKLVEIAGGHLFENAQPVSVFPGFALEGLPNRDSLKYQKLYGLEEASTLLRGTLRYQGYSSVLDAIVKLGLTSDEKKDFLTPNVSDLKWRDLVGKISPDFESRVRSDPFLSKHVDAITNALKELKILSNTPVAARVTPIDTLASLLEQELKYQPLERDMVILTHEFCVTLPNKSKQTIRSAMIKYGAPMTTGFTAMADTVSLPAAIATRLILQNKYSEKGVLRPLSAALYNPMLAELKTHGIDFKTTTVNE